MLGDQIRSIRKRQEITLKELAEKTGLSIGYISQIERNLTDPSLSTLRKISGALGVPTYLFLGDEPHGSLTLRKEEMIQLSQPNSNVRYQIMSPMPTGEFEPQSLVARFELAPRSVDGELPVIHPSEEIVLLERGAVDVIIDGKPVHLEAGDTTLIRSNLPHILSNPTDEVAMGYSILTPAVWFPSTHRNPKPGHKA
ncbi:MAG TPA: helix-turn-helix domain-containing protein [Candidatus Acutalibacter stercorigallinarum]|nr:helix-turn-helix domain-containing protein [Candidatus Acutalibacter stercorigallinarum]